MRQQRNAGGIKLTTRTKQYIGFSKRRAIRSDFGVDDFNCGYTLIDDNQLFDFFMECPGKWATSQAVILLRVDTALTYAESKTGAENEMSATAVQILKDASKYKYLVIES